MYAFDIFSFDPKQAGMSLRAGILAKFLFAKRMAELKRDKRLKRGQ